MNKESVVIFDIDCTLSDADWRYHLIEKKPKNWNKYFELSIEDAPIWETVDILNNYAINDGFKILFVTGRNESVRKITLDWLRTNIHPDISTYSLYMRKDGDYRPGVIIKKEILEQDIMPYCIVIAAFDDREDICKMYAEHGITAFKVMR